MLENKEVRFQNNGKEGNNNDARVKETDYRSRTNYEFLQEIGNVILKKIK